MGDEVVLICEATGAPGGLPIGVRCVAVFNVETL